MSVTEEQFTEQEMTLLAQRVELEERIKHGILKLLLCDLEKLPCTVLVQLQRDLEDWFR